MIYIACFLFSTFFIWLGTKDYYNVSTKTIEKTHIKPRFFSTALGIAVPCLLAALRDISVGTDTSFYVVSYFNQAASINGIFKYIEAVAGQGYDWAYMLLNFLVTRFTNDIGVLFFIAEMLIVTFFFMGCWNLKNHAYPWLSMLFFYLTFFNITLSTLRQSCACAIVFYVLTLVFQDKIKKKNLVAIVSLMFLAILFHATAAFALVIIFVYSFITSKKRGLCYIIIFCLLGGGVIKGNPQFLGNVVLFFASFLNKKYTGRSDLITNVGAGAFLTNICMTIFILVILHLLQRVRDSEQGKKLNKVLFGMNVIYICAIFFASNLYFIPRLMFYIQILWNIPLAQVIKLVKQTKINKILVVTLAVIIVSMYWIYYFIIIGVHGTYPYRLR